MAVLADQTIVGQIGRVYELRTVGKDSLEVLDFTVAVTPRKKVDNEWTDGTTYWITITAWGKLAKNISESFRPGDRVFVIGRTEMKDGYTNKEGVEVAARPTLVASYAGLELAYHPAHSAREAKNGGGNSRPSAGSSSSSSSSSRPAEKKAEPKDDDLDLSFDDSDDADDFSPF